MLVMDTGGQVQDGGHQGLGGRGRDGDGRGHDLARVSGLGYLDLIPGWQGLETLTGGQLV